MEHWISPTASGDDSSAAVQQACLQRSRAKMIAFTPSLPISGRAEKAEWRRRNIPSAVSNPNMEGSSCGGVICAHKNPANREPRRYRQTVSKTKHYRAALQRSKPIAFGDGLQMCSADEVFGQDP